MTTILFQYEGWTLPRLLASFELVFERDDDDSQRLGDLQGGG